jgi:SAM-dependent methyltransferase
MEEKLYTELSWLWPMWGDPNTEYARYCEFVTNIIERGTQISVKTLLDIGCGGGKNLFNLKKRYVAAGLDISADMLYLAKELNPGCELVQGDMRRFSLGKKYDAILIDDAIGYMVTGEEIASVFRCAYDHLNPGGVMVVTPEFTEEFVQNETMTYKGEKTIDGKHIEVVFIENNYDPDPEDDTYESTLVFLIRENGKLRIESDNHTLGIFNSDTWRTLLRNAGFSFSEYLYKEGTRVYTTFGCVRYL